jgi:hypothetical protein
MNQWFSLTCDRYGHLIATVGGSPSKIDRSSEASNREPIMLAPRSAQSVERNSKKSVPFDSLLQTVAGKSPVRRILVPIDAAHVVAADLIAVPLSLDFVSHCWTTKELLDELVRRANCAVLGAPSALGN